MAIDWPTFNLSLGLTQPHDGALKSGSKLCAGDHRVASRRVISLMCATRNQASALAVDSSQSDLDCPASDSLQRLLKFGAGIAAIGEEMAQERVSCTDLFQNLRCAIPILNSGAVHREPDKQTDRVRHDVALSSLNPLAGVVPANPPL